jgi:ParB family chromosome partitioning protein
LGASAPTLPKLVARDLTISRTRVIRQALGADPDVALALCVGALAHRGLRRSDMPGVGIAAHLREVDDLTSLAESRAGLEYQLPDDNLDTLDWALGLSRDRLLEILAVLTASCLDLAHEGASPADLRLQSIGDRLAQHLDIDMTRVWKADLDYWLRLPKATLIDVLMEASDAPDGSAKRTNLLKAYAKLRKSELAAKAAVLHDKTGYLPALLVTPIAAGGIEVTPAGAAALEIPAVAAE